MIKISNRSLIRVSGEDARKFLQGLITNDVEKLTPENAVYAAMQTPQGKYLFDFILHEVNGDIFIDVNAGRAEALLKRLSMYKLRSKLELKPEPTFNVYYDLEYGVVDPRSSKLGKRYVTDEEQTEDGSLEDYENLRLNVGVPDNGDLVPEDAFIMQNNFEELNGVDFNKGCYVGQEIVARMKYKGTTRKALFRVTGKTQLPPHGAVIKSGEKKIGEMLNSQNHLGLANCEISEVVDNKTYIAGDAEVTLQSLAL